MQKAIIGKKIGMTQIFDEKGRVVPVTVVEAGPCVVTTKKTVENDGYASVQLGFGDLKPNKVNKPMKGFFDKNNVAPKKTLKEFRFEDTDAYEVGQLVVSSSRQTFSPPATRSTLPARARVKAPPASSRDGTSTVSKKLTVPVPAYVTADPSAPAPLPQEFGRARRWQVTSAPSR